MVFGAESCLSEHDKNNVLTGSASDNWLLGNCGNDVLVGDLIDGPHRNDTFVFNGAVDLGDTKLVVLKGVTMSTLTASYVLFG